MLIVFALGGLGWWWWQRRQPKPVEDEEIIDEPKADGKAHGKSTH